MIKLHLCNVPSSYYFLTLVLKFILKLHTDNKLGAVCNTARSANNISLKDLISGR